MSVLMQEFDRVQRDRARTRGLIVAAIVAGVGAWLTGPYGVLLIATGEPFGWALAVAGAVLLAGCVVAIVAAARSRATPASLPGKANPRFDEPEPSPDPRGGYSMSGSYLGSH
jgi:predicted tellurium resistance membrane protein TerC